MMEDKEMQILKDRIRKDGKIREGNVLKVDSFLNHQMDVPCSVRSEKSSNADLKGKRSQRS